MRYVIAPGHISTIPAGCERRAPGGSRRTSVAHSFRGATTRLAPLRACAALRRGSLALAARGLLGCALVAVACSGQPARHQAASAPAPTPASAPRPAASGPSLYDLALPLTSSSGGSVGLDVDRGHPTLISMFYGSCAASCPVLIGTIARALDQLPEDVRGDARVLLVSFDPARDTPERLRELAAAHHLDDRWTLASARDSDARTLAAVLGIRYRVVARGQFFHTSAVVALDRAGRTTARMDGLGDPTQLVAALREP